MIPDEEIRRAATPTRGDVLAAKVGILATVEGGASPQITEVMERVEGAAMQPGQQLLLQPSDVGYVIDPSSPAVAHVRGLLAFEWALAELIGDGLISRVDESGFRRVEVQLSGQGRGVEVARAPSTTGHRISLSHRAASGGLLEPDTFIDGTQALLGEHGLHCVREGLRALRLGLCVAAVSLIAIASEAAWYHLGEQIEPRSKELEAALGRDSIGAVIELTAAVLATTKLDGASQKIPVGLARSHADLMRSLRNELVHPRGGGKAFRTLDEASVSLIFLRTQSDFRYLSRHLTTTTS